MRFFNPGVPCGRLEYLLLSILSNVAIVVTIVSFLRFGVVDINSQEFTYEADRIMWTIGIIIGIIFFQMLTTQRRLYDLHMGSGALVLLFIPFVSQFFQLFLFLSAGIKRETVAPYGDDPYDPNSWVKPTVPGQSSAPAVTYRGEALTLPGEDGWGNSDAA